MKNARVRQFETNQLADLVDFVNAHPRLEMADAYRRVIVKSEFGGVIGRVRVTSLARVRDFRAALVGFMALRDSGTLYNHDDPRKVRK